MSLLTLSQGSEYSLSVSKSKFDAFVFPCQSETDFKNKLFDLKTKFPKATHYCYAYLLLAPERARANDDGEPSGSAGYPILGQIKSAGLMNVGCVVCRYYGGTKLGVSGLIAAYKEVTAKAILSSQITPLVIIKTISIRGNYIQMMKFMSRANQHKWRCFLQENNDEPSLLLEIENNQFDEVVNSISLFSDLQIFEI